MDRTGREHYTEGAMAEVKDSPVLRMKTYGQPKSKVRVGGSTPGGWAVGGGLPIGGRKRAQVKVICWNTVFLKPNHE